MSDEESFQGLVGEDVKPLNIAARAELNKNTDSKISQKNRRKSAVEHERQDTDPLSSEPVVMLDPLDVLEFKRPGVQNGVYRKLRLGHYDIEARLDLHKMTVEYARPAVFRFINDCMENDVRTALITHGKGEGRETPALLKSCVAHWLPQLDKVLAFHTAQKQHGSYGATYVLLKKSERKKRESKDKNSPGRVD